MTCGKVFIQCTTYIGGDAWDSLTPYIHNTCYTEYYTDKVTRSISFPSTPVIHVTQQYGVEECIPAIST